MKVIFPSAKGFAKAMEAVWNLVDEGTLRFTKEGIKLEALDPSMISMVIFNMPKDTFLEYELEEEKKISLDIDYLKKILKRAKATDLLELGEEESRFSITFKTEKSKRNFKIPIMDLPTEAPPKLKISYHNYVKILAEPLKDIVKDAEVVSNYVKFIITPDGLEAEAVGEVGEVHESFDKGEEVLEVKAETGGRGNYPIQYVNDVLKAAQKGEVVKLSLGTDAPLKIEYNVEGANVLYYVAPRKTEE